MMYRTVTVTPEIINGTLTVNADLADNTIVVGANFSTTIVQDDAPQYEGPYTVTPLARNQTVLDTNGKLMTDDVTVLEVPYWETSNISGMTVYIANEV